MAIEKRYSLFQRTVRVIQTSIRRLDRWAAERAPGLPNPPEVEERLRQPRFVDLWELTLADHRRIFHEVWHEYKSSFDGPNDEDLQCSKEEVERMITAVRGQVSDTVGKNLSYMDKNLEGSKLHGNLRALREQGMENIAYLNEEIKSMAGDVDSEAIISHTKQVIQDYHSKDNTTTTLKKNVDEFRNLVKDGRDAAFQLNAKDVETFKMSAQSWLVDKLLVGQSVLMAFIEGYREGKKLELERKDALLITFVKQASEDHKDIIEKQIKKMMNKQRESNNETVAMRFQQKSDHASE
ncbi:hypothetical protein PsorP6_002386 [Peronosclerospora sorghi]|uniref:Uncharacterized protein n=1 Tax=Peronosclerospora sorghi TaxID=230839 RepID=A0ACC0WTU2_9STRA|nr:hypothetical protein PsorP6_002386 [Peronosclerospora sorghi]